MKTDIEIAQECELRPIQEIAAKAETEDQTDNEAGQEETTEATAAETTEI